jgi:putative membrane protein insertion efficiency factor
MELNMIQFADFMTHLIILFIRIYKLCFSAFFPKACRFLPTCSEYAIESITKYGILKGLKYSMKRLLSCHPFGRSGYDPVDNKGHKK